MIRENTNSWFVLLLGILLYSINCWDSYDENGDYICELHGRTLDEYRNEEEVIDEDALEDDIKNQLEVEEFIDYQSGYC